MAYVSSQLANGQLANTKGTLYTVPALTVTIVKSITVVNTDSSARTINLYIKKAAGTSRRICPKDLSLGIGACYTIDDDKTLGAGDLIEGDCSAATVADYVISGAENV